jgi:hypothetical protein
MAVINLEVEKIDLACTQPPTARSLSSPAWLQCSASQPSHFEVENIDLVDTQPPSPVTET